GNPEWRPRFANLARSDWGILLKVADPVVQADLFDQLLSWAIPIGESQERIESDHGVGLTASTLAPHTKPRQQVRNGPESRPSRILVESEAALHTDGGDCNRFLFQLNGDGSSLHSVVLLRRKRRDPIPASGLGVRHNPAGPAGTNGQMGSASTG